MTQLNGEAAIAWLQAKGTNAVGRCLETIWDAYGDPPSPVTYPNAYAACRASGQLQTSYPPPRGATIWLGPSPTRTDKNKNAGDVAVSLGGGLAIGTDYPVDGKIGVFTIAQRAAQTHRPYLGWTDNLAGNPITYDQPAQLQLHTAIQEDTVANASNYTLYHRPTGQFFLAGSGKYLAIGDAFTKETGLDGQNVVDDLVKDGVAVKELDAATYDQLNVVYAALAGTKAA